MQPAAFLCVICVICEKITTQEYSSYCTKKTLKSPADLADDADKPQNYNNPKTKLATNCLYLRDNAACCIPLRNQRYLRENNHMRVLKLYCTNETPMSPADLADDADKLQNYNNPKTKLATNCLFSAE